MTHYIDLLSIQTAKHLRQGFEKRVRFDGGAFKVNIFETFQSSTKVKITYEGLSISGMIRGRKVVQTESGEVLDFVPGTSLILHEGQSILADFPDAGPHAPVQCVTVLIPQKKLVEQVDFLPPRQKPLIISGFFYFRTYFGQKLLIFQLNIKIGKSRLG
jgi:uncharacterized cupin superfamily protein